MKNIHIKYLISIVVLVICIYFIREIIFLLTTFGSLTFRSFDSKIMDYSPVNFDFLGPSVTREYFTPNQNVNMPINTNYSCSNICGTQNRCRITGEQCTSDVNCFGCQPKKFYKNGVIHPHADKKHGYTWVLGGTNIFYPENKRHHNAHVSDPKPLMEGFSPAPNYNKGVNTWRSVFDIGMDLYKERYEPKGLPFELNYPKEYTLSGEFLQSVPYAANV